MGLACRIRKDNKGNITEVLNTKGESSKLFEDLLLATQNVDKALKVWAMHSLEGVQKMYGYSENPDDFRASDLLNYYDSKKAIDTKVAPEDIFDAKTMMRRKGFTSLSAFVATLKNIFYTNGVLNFDIDKAVNSGLYSPQDALTVDVNKVSSTIAKLEEEASTNDFTIEATPEEFVYFDPNVKTVFGTSTPVSLQELTDEWIDSIENFNNREEVLAKLEALPYPDFVVQMTADFDLMFERISRMQRVDTLQIKDGKLQVQKTDTNSTVTNTIRNNINYQELEEELRYIDDILPTVWQETQQDVKGVLKEIEEVAVKEGIDIIGLSNLVASKTKVMELLTATVNMAKNPTQENIDIFSEVHDRLIPKAPQREVMKFDENLRGKKIVRVFSNLSANEMFEQYNLIEIAPNLYHRVKNNEPLEELEDILRRKIGRPEATSVELQVYLSEQRPGTPQRMAIYQEIFNHPKRAESTEDVEFLEGIVEDEQYLRTDFVADFYQYVLEQKLANTPLYNKVLKHIKFTAQDISIETPIEDMQNTEYFRELTDYLRIRKNTNGKQFIPKELKTTPTQPLIAVNNPQSFPPYQEYTLTRGNLIATKPQQQPILRVGEDVYQQIATNDNVSVYAKLKKNTNPLYYTTKVEKLPYEQKQVQRLLEEDLASKTPLVEKQKQAGLLSPMMEKLREKATDVRTTINKAVNFSVSAWHGSPHFFDRFSTKNIGTGEGAQAFGWGLYFTDIESIAKHYASLKVNAFKGNTIPSESEAKILKEYYGESLIQNYLNTTTTYPQGSFIYLPDKGDVSRYFQQNGNQWDYIEERYVEEENDEGEIEEYQEILKTPAKAQDFLVNMVRTEYSEQLISGILTSRNLYKVSLHQGKTPDQYTWLEWDKPVSEDVVDKLKDSLSGQMGMGNEYELFSEGLDSFYVQGTGRDLYNYVSWFFREGNKQQLLDSQELPDFIPDIREKNADKEASLLLLEAGIDGIKYPAESISRGATSDTARGFNYVVFDENAITIEEQIQFQMGKAPTQTDITFNQNLVDFIRSKGVTVITDLKTIEEKLNKIGFDSINAIIAGRLGATNLDLKEESNRRMRNLSVAQRMEKEGRGARVIRLATGWEKGVDGKWKYEILDGTINPKVVEQISKQTPQTIETDFYFEGKLKDVLIDTELFNAYPQLAEMEIQINKELDPTYQEAFYTGEDIFVASDPNNILTPLLHEIQHAIQDIEGFAKGGNEGAFDKLTNEEKQEYFDRLNKKSEKLREKYPKIPLITLENYKDIPDNFYYDFYAKLAGEVEAVNVEDRRNLTQKQRREKLLKDTEYIRRDEQYVSFKMLGGMQFLQTPKGNILGFEHNGTIYLDPTQLNTTTTLHELIHVYQSILDIKAQKGDLTAREIISKRRELFQEEADFWKEYHKNRVGTGQGNQMIAGEVGATNLDLADRTNVRMNNLTVARQMESEGKDAKTIRLATGWERGADGKWRYEIKKERQALEKYLPAFNKLVQKGLEGKPEMTFLLPEVLGRNSFILKAYPQLADLKVTINRERKEGPLGSHNFARNTVTINTRVIRGDKKGEMRIDEQYRIFLHEVQHAIQRIELFALGGNYGNFSPEKSKELLEEKIREHQTKSQNIRERIKELKEQDYTLEEFYESVNQKEINKLQVELYHNERQLQYMSQFLPDARGYTYTRLAGEVEARNVEKRLKMSPVQRRETLLAETEDVAREDQIIMFQAIQNYNTELSALGIDLTSDVYAKRKGETDTEYNDRLLKEIEAYVTAPQMAEKLENIRKENPTLWQKLVDFISQLTNYLKTQLGLQDYQGDILNLTKEQYIDALGVSVLKDEYSPNFQTAKNSASLNRVLLDSNVQFVQELTEEEELDLYNEVDNCTL